MNVSTVTLRMISLAMLIITIGRRGGMKKKTGMNDHAGSPLMVRSL